MCVICTLCLAVTGLVTLWGTVILPRSEESTRLRSLQDLGSICRHTEPHLSVVKFNGHPNIKLSNEFLCRDAFRGKTARNLSIQVHPANGQLFERQWRSTNSIGNFSVKIAVESIVVFGRWVETELSRYVNRLNVDVSSSVVVNIDDREDRIGRLAMYSNLSHMNFCGVLLCLYRGNHAHVSSQYVNIRGLVLHFLNLQFEGSSLILRGNSQIVRIGSTCSNFLECCVGSIGGAFGSCSGFSHLSQLPVINERDYNIDDDASGVDSNEPPFSDLDVSFKRLHGFALFTLGAALGLLSDSILMRRDWLHWTLGRKLFLGIGGWVIAAVLIWHGASLILGID